VLAVRPSHRPYENLVFQPCLSDWQLEMLVQAQAAVGRNIRDSRQQGPKKNANRADLTGARRQYNWGSDRVWAVEL